MKKLLGKISALFVALVTLFALIGCDLVPQGGKDFPKLLAPEVTVNGNGVATWESVDGAIYYIYTIDGGQERLIDVCRVRLKENETVKVKAVGGEGYSDSDFSAPKQYIKGAVVKLSVPQVALEGDEAVWQKVAGAQYYVYTIDNGAEKTTTVCTVRLNANESIRVKAVGEGYADSDFSASVTYEKSDHEHADANNDGVCDTCKESVVTELSFYAVNDLHGKYKDTDTQPGVDEFTTYLKTLYADDEREEILLSSGDMWQGTVESSSNRGKLMTEWMNEVGFVSMTLGNHEYDWGAPVLTPNSKLANFPFLAINVTYNGRPVDYCQGSTVVERGGVKIGIIGAIGDCLSSISGDFTSGLAFATGSALTTLVRNESTRLRNEEGCDFIVYSIHDGYENSLSGVTSVTNGDIAYYDTALSDGYVDLVFEAHTHQSYILQDEHGVYHLQGGGENRFVSSAEVSYNTVTEKFSVTPRLINSYEYADSSLKDDPVVETIYKKYFPTSDPYTTVLGVNSSKRQSDDICWQVAKLYYETGVEEWGSQYDIALGGGFLNTRNPYNLSAGNVTYANLFTLLPFDNEIVLGRIRGSDLKTKFIDNSRYHCYATLSSSDVSNSQYYYIVVDSYTSTYKSNNITEVARSGNGKYARDLLADFISRGGWDGA